MYQEICSGRLQIKIIQVINIDFNNISSLYKAKEITIYKRNIFIESDVGIINEQKETTHSAVFSYQTEQVIYGGDRFARVVIRFEKSKQTRYYRSY